MRFFIIKAGRWILLLAAALAAVSPAANAQMEWNGSQTTSWFNGSNWSPAGVPGSTDDVVIDTDMPNFTLIQLADADAAAVTVGDFGRAQLRIDSGRRLTSGGNERIGKESGSHGQVSVSGAGSLWDLSGNSLAVGNWGTGNLYVQNGGRVQGNIIDIGRHIGSLGTVAVTGMQSEIDHTGNIDLGSGGAATLDITDGGKVTSGSVGFVGLGVGYGSVTVSGAGSAWGLGGDLNIGSAGASSSVSISDNALLNNAHGIIGNFATQAGTVTVTGSTWNNSDSLTVGGGGAGALIIEDGAAVSNALSARIAAEEDAQGTVTVSGAGTTWTSGGSMSVGRGGDGVLTIASDSQVIANSAAVIGLDSSAEGVVTVSGNGSSWTVGDSLTIGEQSGAAGSLIIEDGALVDIGAWSIIGDSDQTQGDVLVTGSGSSWQVGEDLTVGGHPSADAVLTITEGAAVTVEGAVAVADVNTGTGCACRLRVNGSLLADDGNVIHAGGWLGGAGAIGEDTTTIAGTVAPGDPVGTLSTSELFFESSAVLEFELDGPGGVGDRISVVGPSDDLTLDGTLQVSDLGGFGEGTYTLIEYTGVLQDNTLTLGSLPPGFTATVDTSTAGEVNLVVTQLPDDVFADRFEQ